MAAYRLTTPDPDGPVLRIEDRAWIPASPLNRDWVEYQAWRAEGNAPDAFDISTSPPPLNIAPTE